MAVYQINYKPKYPQVHRELETHRFSVLVAHRRFGKTVLSVNHLIKQAVNAKRERSVYAYIGPLRNQAKQVAWSYLKHYTANLPRTRINESELTIVIANGSTIRICGADNPDALRGMYFDGVVMDEVAQMKGEVWTEIVQPALADRLGWAVFIGTPKGINLFSELYYKALEKMAEGSKDWVGLSFPVTETDVIDKEEVARLKEDLSDNEFRQEMLCDFGASADNVLITIDEARAAAQNHFDEGICAQYPLVIGVDVARYGADNTVFFARRGFQTFTPKILHNLSNVDVAHKLVAYIAEMKPAYVFIDQGQGTGVIDLILSLTMERSVEVIEIPFGSRANNPLKFINRRAEMWYSMREWLRKGGCIPNEMLLIAELSAPTYNYDAAGRIKLEPKDDIKARLKRSCDLADALCLTFAIDLPADRANVMKTLDEYGEESATKMREWILGSSVSHKSERECVFQW